jgi:hypothetical protein
MRVQPDNCILRVLSFISSAHAYVLHRGRKKIEPPAQQKTDGYVYTVTHDPCRRATKGACFARLLPLYSSGIAARPGPPLLLALQRTVRWSNFDRRDPKMGVFLQSAEATPCGHLLK